MSHFHLSNIEEVAREREAAAVEEARKARLVLESRAGKPGLGGRVLLSLGEALVALGLRLKDRSGMVAHPSERPARRMA